MYVYINYKVDRPVCWLASAEEFGSCGAPAHRNFGRSSRNYISSQLNGPSQTSSIAPFVCINPAQHMGGHTRIPAAVAAYLCVREALGVHRDGDVLGNDHLPIEPAAVQLAERSHRRRHIPVLDVHCALFGWIHRPFGRVRRVQR